MDSPYTYTPSPEFINSLEFDYVETYSFQRGIEYEDNQIILRKEFNLLKAESSDGMTLTPEYKARLEELNKRLNYTQYLLDENGKFHQSAQKTSTISSNDEKLMTIKAILQTEVITVPRFLCAPFYRDAIVFYDKGGQIVSALNICLSCYYMETEPFSNINSDVVTYQLITNFLVKQRHEVPLIDRKNIDEYTRLMTQNRPLI
ncbi:hypothetical protein HNQ91_003572 [Filimonas zeae]|uniref:Uncharacterized protein n=1 Tax=Filimonas zeae TaxID=1737353 RepID=A0A917J107_9BACT|nr:hypothetical protein [Filimonas zeae]MDR6340507.1 hypothetical protein [Filimonas zeae]GGH73074.1 hypothetical protein GCM10011379_34180 [Filimonas zeae]